MIRLARIGKKKQPQYRLVVSEKARDMYGRALDIVGHYNPRSKEAVLHNDRITHWLTNGAQCSATVHNLLITNGIIEGKKAATSTINTKKRTKLAEKEREAAEAKAAAEETQKAEASEAPAEKPEETSETATEADPKKPETSAADKSNEDTEEKKEA